MLQGWTGWGAERSHGIYAHSSLVLLSCLQKARNDNSEKGCKGKLIMENSSLSS